MARVFIYPRRSSVLYFGRWHSSTGLLPTKLGMMMCILSRPMNHESQNKKAALGNVTHCRRGRPPTPPPAAARRRRPPAPTNATYSTLPRQRRGTPTDASALPPRRPRPNDAAVRALHPRHLDNAMTRPPLPHPPPSHPTTANPQAP